MRDQQKDDGERAGNDDACRAPQQVAGATEPSEPHGNCDKLGGDRRDIGTAGANLDRRVSRKDTSQPVFRESKEIEWLVVDARRKWHGPEKGPAGPEDSMDFIDQSLRVFDMLENFR